ncbi:hypothetical protein BFF94_027025 [Burkholderia catarinensis]|nr:hypothetical protein BFF94_027025 [Burkholderia catarinensis]
MRPSIDTVFPVNDVFSYEREKHLGEVHNFVMVQEREREWSLERAIEACRRLVDDAYREFRRLQGALRQTDVLPKSAGEREWRQLEHYVGMWHDLIIGQANARPRCGPIAGTERTSRVAPPVCELYEHVVIADCAYAHSAAICDLSPTSAIPNKKASRRMHRGPLYKVIDTDSIFGRAA